MQHHEGISETLHANTDGTMSHVRSANFGRGIIVHINYTVEVVGNDFGYVMEPIEVVLANGGRAREARLQTAISSGEEYSMILVQYERDNIHAVVYPRSDVVHPRQPNSRFCGSRSLLWRSILSRAFLRMWCIATDLVAGMMHGPRRHVRDCFTYYCVAHR